MIFTMITSAWNWLACYTPALCELHTKSVSKTKTTVSPLTPQGHTKQYENANTQSFHKHKANTSHNSLDHTMAITHNSQYTLTGYVNNETLTLGILRNTLGAYISNATLHNVSNTILVVSEYDAYNLIISRLNLGLWISIASATRGKVYLQFSWYRSRNHHGCRDCNIATPVQVSIQCTVQELQQLIITFTVLV